MAICVVALIEIHPRHLGLMCLREIFCPGEGGERRFIVRARRGAACSGVVVPVG